MSISFSLGVDDGTWLSTLSNLESYGSLAVPARFCGRRISPNFLSWNDVLLRETQAGLHSSSLDQLRYEHLPTSTLCNTGRSQYPHVSFYAWTENASTLIPVFPSHPWPVHGHRALDHKIILRWSGLDTTNSAAPPCYSQALLAHAHEDLRSSYPGMMRLPTVRHPFLLPFCMR